MKRTTGVVLTLFLLALTGDPRAQQPSVRAVAATTRRIVPSGFYNWRGAATQALVTTIWYPAAPGATMSPHDVGQPSQPLFRLGMWADDADPMAGRFPLLLLSHGTGGSAQIMAWLGRSLAERGYVVAAVNHPGNNALEEYTAEGFLFWWERARDLTETLDGLLRDPDLRRIIDPQRVGAVGFSLGGYTTLAIAGARTDPTRFRAFCKSTEAEGCAAPPEYPDLFKRWDTLAIGSRAFRESMAQAGRPYRDNRIKSVMAIAPALGPALIPDSLGRVRIPVAIVAGSDDAIVPIRPNALRMAALIPRAQITLIPGAGHYTFLAECTAEGRARQPQLCADTDHIDRSVIHARVVALADAFFARTLPVAR